MTGRVIPEELLQRVMEQVPASVQILRKQVDLFVEVFNGKGTTPQLVSPDDMPWEQFARLWANNNNNSV